MEQTVRRISSHGEEVTAMLPINDNCIFVTCGESIFVVDCRVRVKETIRVDSLLSEVTVKVTALLDTGTHLWVAANNSILRLNSAVSYLALLHFFIEIEFNLFCLKDKQTCEYFRTNS